jgi:hypothetical protein
MSKKDEVYKRVRVVSLVTALPLVMCAGPLSGYICGKYLAAKVHLPHVLSICVLLGSLGSAFEAYRIIRIVIKIND